MKPVPYRYVSKEGEPITEMRQAYTKPLGDVARRLELLGYTIDRAQQRYLKMLANNGLDSDIPELTFDAFVNALCAVDPTDETPDYKNEHDFGMAYGREMGLKLCRAFGDEQFAPKRYTLNETLHDLLLDAWSILALFALKPTNHDQPVTWRFADLVEGGWADRQDFWHVLHGSKQFLIVTEGSSDAKILAHALDLLRPSIAEYFYFVDMEQGYPFTGTGNVLNFCRGLSKIRILNNVLVIYDNDAEGVTRHADTLTLTLPTNMRTMQLPELKRFERFRTIGPEGTGMGDINGRAAAIESYLDLNWNTKKEPVVRWTSYNPKLSKYQGELVGKESYTKAFLRLQKTEAGYDFTGLDAVLDIMIKE